MTCDDCKREYQNLYGAIVEGKYGQYCKNCITAGKRMHHPGSAQYSRDRDREDNAKDLLQPWDARGKPNTEFIRNYKEEAEEIFTQEELEANG